VNARLKIWKDEEFMVFYAGFQFKDWVVPLVSFYSLEDFAEFIEDCSDVIVDAVNEQARNDGELLEDNIKDFINSIE